MKKHLGKLTRRHMTITMSDLMREQLDDVVAYEQTTKSELIERVLREFFARYTFPTKDRNH